MLEAEGGCKATSAAAAAAASSRGVVGHCGNKKVITVEDKCPRYGLVYPTNKLFCDRPAVGRSAADNEPKFSRRQKPDSGWNSTVERASGGGGERSSACMRARKKSDTIVFRCVSPLRIREAPRSVDRTDPRLPIGKWRQMPTMYDVGLQQSAGGSAG